MFTRRQTFVFYSVSVLLALFVAGFLTLELQHREPPLGRFRDLPDFSLTNQDGAAVTLADLKGKVWLSDFVYTTCPGPCPIISAHMARLQGEVASPDVRFVSISTDPASDTPAVLKKYAERFHASSRWLFLTGPQPVVYDFIRNGFMLAIQAPAGAPIIHSTKMMLVDKQGSIRNFYDGATMTDDPEILHDIDRLLRE